MERSKEIEVHVAGLVMDPGSNAPIVILKELVGEHALPIWIGLAEATAIASAIKRVPFSRPMTHDLLKNVIDDLGGRVRRIVITSLRDSTFIANIELTVGDTLHVIDSRPSDALAIAVRVDVPIFVHPDVFEAAKVQIVNSELGGDNLPTQKTEENERTTEDPASEVDRPDFSAVEKDRWAELLADMDPDDFKFKM